MIVRSEEGAQLLWRELSSEARGLLEGKLRGLYGHAQDEAAFDNLATDKQQALLLIAGRLHHLKLWESVRRVGNVYGTNGVGMNFEAWPELVSRLRSRNDFTRLFARHRGNAGGFIERGRAHATVHFLYQENKANERLWAVHFDLYNPLFSPGGAWRHLLREKVGGLTPDWRMVRAALERQ